MSVKVQKQINEIAKMIGANLVPDWRDRVNVCINNARHDVELDIARNLLDSELFSSNHSGSPSKRPEVYVAILFALSELTELVSRDFLASHCFVGAMAVLAISVFARFWGFGGKTLLFRTRV
mgnify:CR=1 FL=1